MKSRTLISYRCHGFLKLANLIFDLVLDRINVLFVVLDFEIDLLFESGHIILHKVVHDPFDFGLIDLLRDLLLLKVRIQLIIQRNLIIVSFSLLIGCMIDINSHLEEFLSFELDYLFGTFLLHHFEQL